MRWRAWWSIAGSSWVRSWPQISLMTPIAARRRARWPTVARSRPVARGTRRGSRGAAAGLARRRRNHHRLSVFSPAEGLGIQFRKQVLGQGAGIALHQHHKDEVYYVLAGHGTCIVDGQLHKVRAGHAMLTLPESTHAVQQSGDEGLVILITYTSAPRSIDQSRARVEWVTRPAAASPIVDNWTPRPAEATGALLSRDPGPGAPQHRPIPAHGGAPILAPARQACSRRCASAHAMRTSPGVYPGWSCIACT